MRPIFERTPDTAQEIIIHNCLHVLAVSILFYDHFITLGREIEYIWKRPKSISSYYFFLNRYTALLGTLVVTVLSLTTLPLQSCKNYNTARQLLLIINQCIICYLLSLRVYALYGRSHWIRSLLGCTAAILTAISFWLLRRQKIAPAEGITGCHIGISDKTAIRMSGAWWALFIYDALLFALTVSKTWTTGKSYATSVLVSRILLRDGSVYFGVITLSNFANILTYYFCGPFMRGGLSAFSADISSTMMSHLMLNLHEVTNTGIHSTLELSHVELDTLWSEALDCSSTTSTASHDHGANTDEES
ncbi:hypothetical protein BDZ94DRAFT_1242693 [Collybia nuda]|uniref:DUF6533 domain-containing protein n=1 Tax=Collybia nuda TaxID=64659 RepID=A0A9P6CPU2_9AGAR|nr:hypothetical protein BDZ94DRAFT_1242693 [Collybia nuda]